MTRPKFRFPLAETLAVIGIAFGAWLIHNTFRPFADRPNYALLAVGALDILLCFAWLGYLLRGRLRDGQALPRSWIVVGVLWIACFVGWIAALFLDSDRALAEQDQHQEYLAQVAKLETSVRQFGDVIAPANPSPALPRFALPDADRGTWQTSHDEFVRISDQLHASLRTKSAWEAELKRVDEQVKQMQKTFLLLIAEGGLEQRLQRRAEFHQSRDRALQTVAALHTAIGKGERDLAATYRARWHGVGAAALTGVILLAGCLLFWLVFDRELRRSWRARARLAGEEARFRSLIENQVEPIAILDEAANFLYVNPAWQSAFGYDLSQLQSGNLLALIHEQDRAAIQALMRSNDPRSATRCRLSGDYGIWHDVEIQSQALTEPGALQIRIREPRETATAAIQPQPELPPDTAEKLHAAETRLAELEAECAVLRERDGQVNQELQKARLLLGSHQQANTDGLLVLSTRGDLLSWNQAFVRLWKLSEVTLTGHGWPTIAAHMETQVASGWTEFQRAAAGRAVGANAMAWEMSLEGGRVVEVQAQTVQANGGTGLSPLEGAVQFHFRDVTASKDLHTQLQDQEQARKAQEARVREHEKRAKQLEKELKERDRQREEMEETLRDHQDRLHQMHRLHEASAASLKVSQDATRRLASGVANELNSHLSVILGNTEVLRDTLPRDHIAQNYLNDIHETASRCTDLSQRLIAYSGNHLLQMVPVEMAQFLASLDGKLRNALGYNVQLKIESEGKKLWAKLDPHPLEQAILHLANQARQQMPQGGTVTIHASRVELSRSQLSQADMEPGAYIQVRLTDSGAGLDEGTLTHLFEPYHPITPGQKGDLSLATAQGIVRQSGGCIDVATEPGLGTEWTILLPETKERPNDKNLRASA